MPFKSKKQMKWMKENRPELYEEFLKETEDVSKLPLRSKAEAAKRKKARAKRKSKR